MGKVYLKDLKTILNNGVTIQKWNDDIEDFEVIYQTAVFEHNNADISAEVWNMQVCSINAYTECNNSYVAIEVA